MAFRLNARQVEANRLLGGPQRHTLLYGGSRSGKTFLLCRAVGIRAMRAPKSRHIIARFRFNACKTSIGFDTFPKMMEICFPGVRAVLNKSDWFFEFPNASQVWLAGLDEKERVEKILGQEYVTAYANECSQFKQYASMEVLQTRLAQKVACDDGRLLVPKMYYDCNPPGRGHWLYKVFIQKIKPGSKRDPLANPDNFQAMRLNPHDNVENLGEGYLKTLEEMSDAKRKRFLEGEFLADFDNAMWSIDGLDETRSGELDPYDTADRIALRDRFRRIVVAVDPSGAKGPEDKRSDETGIVVCGEDEAGRYACLEDRTLRAHPDVWGAAAVQAFHDWKADLIIAENNFGGELVAATIQHIDRKVPVVSKNAGSRGKVVRAEPIAALFAKGMAYMVGTHPYLEDQLCEMTTAGYMGEKSPDRVDAMVWAMTELSEGMLGAGLALFSVVRNEAEAKRREEAANPKPAPILHPDDPRPVQYETQKPVHAPGSLEYMRAMTGA